MHVTEALQGKKSRRLMMIRNFPKQEKIKQLEYLRRHDPRIWGASKGKDFRRVDIWPFNGQPMGCAYGLTDAPI